MLAQVDDDGDLRHLLTLEGLKAGLLDAILERAENFLTETGQLARGADELRGLTVANLFFEPSTRTRVSFELAAKRLGAHVTNLEIGSSSTRKGETLLDTFLTLKAMAVDIFVIRHHDPGSTELIAEHADASVRIISAGEAHLSHPTQGLLDVLTIRRHKGDLSTLKVCLVGDIKHSRVARSAGQALTTLGVGELHLVSPETLLPDADEFPAAVLSSDLETGLSNADVVMALRIQKERMAEADIPDDADYFRRFGLTREQLAIAKKDVIVMHPGPMNRNLEIAPDIADGQQSVIEEQVRNGVAVRMAVLALMADR
ncbi:MAG: aspartate carbamoyltransferase catalytic subunit [Gammaproteobacteria bacterium]